VIARPHGVTRPGSTPSSGATRTPPRASEPASVWSGRVAVHDTPGALSAYGSGTPRRYGYAVPQTFSLSSVCPPELEWYAAKIGRPS
jgi:hypothetical protein